MADNYDATQGTGTTFGADDITSVLYPRVKIIVGADGTNDGDVASGNPMPVTDAANEALLTTIDADTSTLAAVDFATDAKLDTLIGHVDDVETLLGTMDADTSALALVDYATSAKQDTIITAVQTVAAAVSTEMQVDVVAALPAGTNAIGKLAANSGVDIGDVDVTTMPGTAAEGAALPSSFVVVAADDGTDTQPLQLSAGGDLKVTLDSEVVTSARATRTLTITSGTAASSGNNTLIASAGASTRHVIGGIVLQLEAATATTMILQDGAGGSALLRVLGQNQGDGISIMFPDGRELRGSADTLLNLNLSGANSCGYTVYSWTEAT